MQQQGGVVPHKNFVGNTCVDKIVIDISLPNNERQHRTLHILKDVLPYAMC